MPGHTIPPYHHRLDIPEMGVPAYPASPHL